MNRQTIVGRVSKSELKHFNGHALLKFSVGCDRRTKRDGQWVKETEWFDCSWWGSRAEALAPHITKGTPVTVISERETREHEGKRYFDYRVHDVALQGSARDGGQSGGNGGGYGGGGAPLPDGPDGFADDDEEGLPF